MLFIFLSNAISRASLARVYIYLVNPQKRDIGLHAHLKF